MRQADRSMLRTGWSPTTACLQRGGSKAPYFLAAQDFEGRFFIGAENAYIVFF